MKLDTYEILRTRGVGIVALKREKPVFLRLKGFLLNVMPKVAWEFACRNKLSRLVRKDGVNVLKVSVFGRN